MDAVSLSQLDEDHPLRANERQWLPRNAANVYVVSVPTRSSAGTSSALTVHLVVYTVSCVHNVDGAPASTRARHIDGCQCNSHASSELLTVWVIDLHATQRVTRHVARNALLSAARDAARVAGAVPAAAGSGGDGVVADDGTVLENEMGMLWDTNDTALTARRNEIRRQYNAHMDVIAKLCGFDPDIVVRHLRRMGANFYTAAIYATPEDEAEARLRFNDWLCPLAGYRYLWSVHTPSELYVDRMAPARALLDVASLRDLLRAMPTVAGLMPTHLIWALSRVACLMNDSFVRMPSQYVGNCAMLAQFLDLLREANWHRAHALPGITLLVDQLATKYSMAALGSPRVAATLDRFLQLSDAITSNTMYAMDVANVDVAAAASTSIDSVLIDAENSLAQGMPLAGPVAEMFAELNAAATDVHAAVWEMMQETHRATEARLGAHMHLTSDHPPSVPVPPLTPTLPDVQRRRTETVDEMVHRVQRQQRLQKMQQNERTVPRKGGRAQRAGVGGRMRRVLPRVASAVAKKTAQIYIDGDEVTRALIREKEPGLRIGYKADGSDAVAVPLHTLRATRINLQPQRILR